MLPEVKRWGEAVERRTVKPFDSWQSLPLHWLGTMLRNLSRKSRKIKCSRNTESGMSNNLLSISGHILSSVHLRSHNFWNWVICWNSWTLEDSGLPRTGGFPKCSGDYRVELFSLLFIIVAFPPLPVISLVFSDWNVPACDFFIGRTIYSDFPSSLYFAAL